MEKKLQFTTVFIEDTYEDMSKQAASILAREINENPTGSFGMATGGTPLGLYRELIALYKEGKVDFSRISTYNLDEYYPIPKSDPQSYYYFMMENLFRHVNMDPTRIHIPDGQASDPEEACRAYDEELNQGSPLTLQLLGLGLNGHIGFNEPGDFCARGTFTVDLSPSSIQANARFFESPDQVPRRALTMGIKSIMQAQTILLVVNGSHKANILKEVLLGPITPQVPGSILQLHRRVIVAADREAAAGLL